MKMIMSLGITRSGERLKMSKLFASAVVYLAALVAIAFWISSVQKINIKGRVSYEYAESK